mmetsp:Transcript_31653/g.62768  ORF Transcript_31653/g.62768 Transcript_31653/m.62768 type:complete len:502 (-) Transcript_31653:70-1575(-)
MSSYRVRRRFAIFLLFVAVFTGRVSPYVSLSTPINPLLFTSPSTLTSNRIFSTMLNAERNSIKEKAGALLLSLSIFTGSLAGAVPSAIAENELAATYGNGKSFDTSLVDQTCLVDKCSLQSKECLVDDPSCRKGLTCTAKCMGDNACITGCMARYGNKHLDDLLKCTIEDNECIKVAILPGGGDKAGEEPSSPVETVKNFQPKQLEGTWYKVAGYNPNYDCYACQRNTFSRERSPSAPGGEEKLLVDVEFSMPRLLEDGSPPPPDNKAEKVFVSDTGSLVGGRSILLNSYKTTETMVFDSPHALKGSAGESITLDSKRYSRTAHSEGEMFGLKFWENWYVIGSNSSPTDPAFKVIYYNGATRQNTYSGAFVYSRTKDLPPASMKEVYGIAREAGLDPDGFCRIRNGCFDGEGPESVPRERGFLEGLVASTKVSELLGVEPVFGQDLIAKVEREIGREEQVVEARARKWYYEVGDYLEDPRRHFKLIDDLRTNVAWPEDVRR